MMKRLLMLLFVVSPVASASAAEPKVAERWAVLIGVDDYANANDLQFCGADQTALRDRLIAAGFRSENIILLHDKAQETKHRPTQRNIEEQIALTIGNAEVEDLVVVGFSGHGVSLGGKSYLCPSDARLGDAATLVSLDGVYDQLHQCSARFKWVLVDACRNDPTLGGGRSFTATEGTKALARSLQDLKLPEGVVLMNSCAPNEISWEEQEFGHGVYMHYVLEGMAGAGDADADGFVSLNELQRHASSRTRAYVTNKFNVLQRPFSRTEGESEVMDFALLPVRVGATPDLASPPASPPASRETTITNSIGMKLTLIPAGEFQMGSPDSDSDASDDEKPQHPVRITQPFYMGAHEVTRGQFARFVAAENYKTEAEVDAKGGWGHDSATKRTELRPGFSWKNIGIEQPDDHPVVNVTWNDAQAFCSWLSRAEGRMYGLPTEAQWEYACRAGTTTKYYCGDDVEGLAKIGNVPDGTARTQYPHWTTIVSRDGYVLAAPVGSFKPNAFGLYDMTGNVWEWCNDWYDKQYYVKSPIDDPKGFSFGSFRVHRGGKYFGSPTFCRSACRFGSNSDFRLLDLGFRVVRLP